MKHTLEEDSKTMNSKQRRKAERAGTPVSVDGWTRRKFILKRVGPGKWTYCGYYISGPLKGPEIGKFDLQNDMEGNLKTYFGYYPTHKPRTNLYPIFVPASTVMGVIPEIGHEYRRLYREFKELMMEYRS